MSLGCFCSINLFLSIPGAIGSKSVIPGASSVPPQRFPLPVAPFCDFHFARHSPSEMQKKLCRRNQVTNLLQKCKLQHAFLLAFVFYFTVCSYFFKNVLPAAARSTFLKKDAKQNAVKNVSFESLLDALALSIPLRRALFRH